MSVINTNVLSLVTQNNLKSSEASLNSAIQRLSSGMRINSAKDDAAGQAIANRFTANIRGLTQAQRNANDGISLAQTTEGALNQVNDNLQRIRELAVQSANGSNSTSDLKSIQDEINQRLAEINRTSDQTDFNGVKVLKDGVGSLSIQVGAKDGETIGIDLQAINSKTLSLNNLDVSKAALDVSKVGAQVTTVKAAAATTVDLKATNSQGAPSYSVYVDNSDADKLYVSTDGGTTIYDVTGYDSATGTLKFDTTAASATAVGSTTAVSGTDKISVNAFAPGVSVEADKVGYADQNAASDPTIYVDENGSFFVSRDGGTNVMSATFTADGKVTYDGSKWGTASEAAPAGALSGALDTYELPGADVKANLSGVSGFDSGTTTELHSLDGGGYVLKGTVNGNDAYFDANVAADGTVTKGAQRNADPLAAIDAALSKVDSLRSSLGAVQNRFDSVISNLGTTVTNLTASRSRIQDADYATEVSNMSRAQILQQAGTSVLAQANQTTQGVLSLLR